MEDRTYAAITADIVGSTEYYKTNGKPLRPRLLEALEKVNDRHRDALAVPFAITLGDEVQGLASDPADAPRVVHDLRLQLSPLKCRVGVGIGSVVSELTETTAQMEGLAFSLSREALVAAASLKSGLTVYRADNRQIESVANAVSLLIDVIQSRWTEKQWEAVRLRTELGDVSRTAAELGVTSPSVEDRLRSTCWREVVQAVDSLREMLKQG